MARNAGHECVLLLKRGIKIPWWFLILSCVKIGHIVENGYKIKVLRIRGGEASFGTGGAVWFQRLPGFQKCVSGYNFFDVDQVLEIRNTKRTSPRSSSTTSVRNWHTCPICYSISRTRLTGRRVGVGMEYHTFACPRCGGSWTVEVY